MISVFAAHYIQDVKIIWTFEIQLCKLTQIS